MKFLTPAQKLKSIRKYLKMTQKDLIDDDISRGLISMIEIEKRELNNNIVLKLVKKFEKKAKELDVPLEIDINYFLRSRDEEAEVYCLNKLKEAITDIDIIKVINIAGEFNLSNIKGIAYSKLGEYHFNNKNYNEAFLAYNNSVDILENIISINHCFTKESEMG
ncbi:helix-turn-helix domain-containing protein [Clostridium saccharoperbutylacetonicum]|uniref:helix-turn-helix domain-containing protein n=1 Tax=Clostridium saccharoperbutylacetonicum TaxID=36745 RepID=UPI0039E953CC